MSTAQLQDRRSPYQVSDELESFFFVILYQGFHWVVHEELNSVNVNRIFEDVRVHNGRQIGGGEKEFIYTQNPGAILTELRFKSPPFTDLIRELFRLFRSLALTNRYKAIARRPYSQDAANVKKLKNCKAIIHLLKTAMERKDWARVCDKAERDRYPDADELARIRREAAHKRQREEGDDASASPAKRIKI
jgi:hypothetical protein